MAVYCYGSINADYIYNVPHLVQPGETLAATSVLRTLGGKGANQSVAAAQAGADVFHIGAVGPDSDWLIALLQSYQVKTDGVRRVSEPTGHAIIQVDPTGENAIVLYPGANRCLPDFHHGQSGDWLLLQNETNGTVEAAKAAQDKHMNVAYSAAPFDPECVQEILPYIDLLLVNEGENKALEENLGSIPAQRIITRGDQGVDWVGVASLPAYPVDRVVDTTGAGDCFAGYLVAGLDQGLSQIDALRRAVIAAALQVTKKGTSEAIPTASEVEALMLR